MKYFYLVWSSIGHFVYVFSSKPPYVERIVYTTWSQFVYFLFTERNLFASSLVHLNYNGLHLGWSSVWKIINFENYVIKNIFFLVIIFPMKVKSVILFSSVYSTFKSKNQFLIILVLTFDKLSVIYLVSYETKFCFELRIILKNEKMGVVSKTRQ